MLRRAMCLGLSLERLVRALNVDLSSINWLQDKQFTLDVTRILRNMTSARQVRAVELMVNTNTNTNTNTNINTITVAHG
jgi:hypothetical protein